MSCEKCKNDYNEFDRKPFVLYDCNHTICSHCLDNYGDSICLICDRLIIYKAKNVDFINYIAQKTNVKYL